MDALYPDAAPEDLSRNGDTTCIICREEMVPKSVAAAGPAATSVIGPNETPKKTLLRSYLPFPLSAKLAGEAAELSDVVRSTHMQRTPH